MKYSIQQICETLYFNKSRFSYQPKQDPCEVVL